MLLPNNANANENVAEVAASVIARCCETSTQQHALEILVDLQGSSLKRREAWLDALRAHVTKRLHSTREILRIV